MRNTKRKGMSKNSIDWQISCKVTVSVPLQRLLSPWGYRVGTSVRSACLPASQAARLNSHKTFTPQDVPTGLGYVALHNVIIKLSCSEISWFNLTLCEAWWGQKLD